ncbi:MAG: fumarylacetoacetate hydrolase family protein [Rhodoferax sp.]|nr:fumarylacetoacetate hydrolase family protein [Rhodoferax sp.]
MQNLLTPQNILPQDHAQAVLIGRIWVDGLGPTLVRVCQDHIYDISGVAPTCTQLLELDDPAAAVRASDAPRIADTAEVLANSVLEQRTAGKPWFLAPCDLQAIKAAGVTFVASMLERVIEEQARGDAGRAEAVRRSVVSVIGDNLRSVRPGSAQAAQLRDVLIGQGVWSQYLEVGIGEDAEIFTKSQPMSAVGVGAEIGLHPKSVWNNPEPEVVLAVNSRGETQGCALGNDVNLRDFEGRSALLLGKAKDNNASAAIGPFIRLFDPRFGIDDVRRCELAMRVTSADGTFEMHGSSSLSMISRDPLELVEQAIGEAGQRTHQYPDGFMLYLGTMFAPTQDRFKPGQGFTHAMGDVVSVSAAGLGMLVNRVNLSDRVAPWNYGAAALMRDLARRGLLA